MKWVSDRKHLTVDAEGLAAMMDGILENITAARQHQALLAENHMELERLVAARTAELMRVHAGRGHHGVCQPVSFCRNALP